MSINQASFVQDRAARWASVGIASLRDEHLNSLPEALWTAGTSIRVADLGGNKLTDVPASLAVLNGLQRLRLSHNQLTHEGIPWIALAALPLLAVVALDHNRWVLDIRHNMQCFVQLFTMQNEHKKQQVWPYIDHDGALSEHIQQRPVFACQHVTMHAVLCLLSVLVKVWFGSRQRPP